MAFSKASLYREYERSTAQIAKAVSHPSRLFILYQLTEGPIQFSTIQEDHPIAKPTLSRHLNVLRNARLIKGENQGLNTSYVLLTENHPLWLKQILLKMKSKYRYARVA